MWEGSFIVTALGARPEWRVNGPPSPRSVGTRTPPGRSASWLAYAPPRRMRSPRSPTCRAPARTIHSVTHLPTGIARRSRGRSWWRRACSQVRPLERRGAVLPAAGSNLSARAGGRLVCYSQPRRLKMAIVPTRTTIITTTTAQKPSIDCSPGTRVFMPKTLAMSVSGSTMTLNAVSTRKVSFSRWQRTASFVDLERLDDLLEVLEHVPDALGRVVDVVEVDLEVLGDVAAGALEVLQRRALRPDDLAEVDDLLLDVGEVAHDLRRSCPRRCPPRGARACCPSCAASGTRRRRSRRRSCRAGSPGPCRTARRGCPRASGSARRGTRAAGSARWAA